MRRLQSVALSLAFMFVFTGSALGQTQAPEMQTLDLTVGEWTYDQTEGTTECKRLGDYMVHCSSEWTNAAGNHVEAVFIIRYDTNAEMYRAHRFYSGGYADSGIGWMNGDSLTFVFEGPDGTMDRMSSSHPPWRSTVTPRSLPVPRSRASSSRWGTSGCFPYRQLR